MDFPSTLTVAITDEHVKQGKKGRAGSCPVALAVNGVLPKECEAYVLPSCSYDGSWYAIIYHINHEGFLRTVTYSISPEQGAAIKAFDKSNTWDFTIKEITLTRNAYEQLA